MLLCSSCTATRGGPGTLEKENGKRPCSVCQKLFERFCIYQPERWSCSLPTAMCEDCASARQCCQVCYCNINTLKLEKIYSNLVPAGGAFLQTDVNMDTIQRRHQHFFSRYITALTPVLTCAVTLESFRHADKESLVDIYSKLCATRFHIESQMHSREQGKDIPITIRLSLTPDQQGAHSFNALTAQTKIIDYIVCTRSITSFFQEIAASRPFSSSLMSINGKLNCSHQAAMQILKFDTKVTLQDYNTYSATMLVRSPHPVELLCLLRNHTECNVELEALI